MKMIGQYKKNGNDYLVLDDVDENKEKNWIRERFSKKIGLNLMMACHWINL